MYSRSIDGRTLTITTSGWTYYSQHVLFDNETGSFWFHMQDSDDLTCIGGHFAGRRLKGVPSMHGPWHVWLEENPTTKYLLDPRAPR